MKGNKKWLGATVTSSMLALNKSSSSTRSSGSGRTSLRSYKYTTSSSGRTGDSGNRNTSGSGRGFPPARQKV